MQFGYFDDDKREYVITQPDTPLPWINYLGSQTYFGLMSNTAGGYSFYKDARLRRLTRYRYNNAPYDVGGRYIYVRDNQSGDFWSSSWQPTRTPLDNYSCRHGMGYPAATVASTIRGMLWRSRRSSSRNGVRAMWATPRSCSISVVIGLILWVHRGAGSRPGSCRRATTRPVRCE